VIGEGDLAAVERWFFATLDHCRKLRDQQSHTEAENSAAGALKMLRVLRETESIHGFFSALVAAPGEEAFMEFLRDAA
jgi:hypothetical protein